MLIIADTSPLFCILVRIEFISCDEKGSKRFCFTAAGLCLNFMFLILSIFTFLVGGTSHVDNISVQEVI